MMAVVCQPLTDETIKQAMDYLAQRDLMVAKASRTYGPPRPRLPIPVDLQGLCTLVFGQQISLAAAAAIRQRWVDHFGTPKDECAMATKILRASEQDFRSIGLSGAKIDCVTRLAQAVLTEGFRLTDLKEMSDEDALRVLQTHRGIGPWTARLFLLFGLHRADVMPAGDLGVRKGYGYALQMSRGADGQHREPEIPTQSELERATADWSPWRSVGTLWLWSVLHHHRGGGQPLG